MKKTPRSPRRRQRDTSINSPRKPPRSPRRRQRSQSGEIDFYLEMFNEYQDKLMEAEKELEMQQHKNDMLHLSKQKLSTQLTYESETGIHGQTQIDDLKLQNRRLQIQVDDIKSSKKEANSESKSFINHLTNSLEEIQSLMKMRTTAGKEEIDKSRTLLSHIRGTFRDIGRKQSAQMTDFVEEWLDRLDYVLTQKSLDSIENMPSESPYRLMWENLDAENAALKGAIRVVQTEDSPQIQQAKDQVDELRAENAQLRKEIKAERRYQKEIAEVSMTEREDREHVLDALVNEKELLGNHVDTLQATVNNQCNIIENLSNIIYNTSQQFSESPNIKQRPPKVNISSVNESQNSKVLKAEISSLDLEIQDLQTSLKNELSFNISD